MDNSLEKLKGKISQSSTGVASESSLLFLYVGILQCVICSCLDGCIEFGLLHIYALSDALKCMQWRCQ